MSGLGVGACNGRQVGLYWREGEPFPKCDVEGVKARGRHHEGMQTRRKVVVVGGGGV